MRNLAGMNPRSKTQNLPASRPSPQPSLNAGRGSISACEGRLRILAQGFIPVLALFLLMPLTAFAHPPSGGPPKPPSKAGADLKKAREAMDAYKTRLTKEGKYACCMKKPAGAKTDSCDICAKTNGSCNCGANLAAGKGVCGECYGAWQGGKGNTAFGKVDMKTLKVLASDQQGGAGAKPPADAPEMIAYTEAMTKAKRTLIAESRYACCVGRGGCDECAYETDCGCGANLAADMEAKSGTPKKGICAQCLDGQHGGHGRLGTIDLASLTLSQMGEMHMEMKGTLGPWSMNREGSGTTWLPDSSPMYGQMGMSGRYRTMQMGMISGVYTDSGGSRGERQFFTPSQYMFMAQRDTGGGTLGLRGMLSLDPLLIGKKGYPDLFQTGETYLGQPLKDRQHPHDLIMELAATYSKKLAGNTRGFLYLAPAGEPPIGPAAFPHRPSAWDNPMAPITHHWLDGSHITYGVATAGLTFGDKWKLEGSIFTGREPDENRYDLDTMRFDSFAGRLTYNPSKNWSFQTSYASLRHPEALEPGSQHRFTLSAQYNRAFANGDNLALMLAYGQNVKPTGSPDAWILEGAYTRGRTIWFGRYENVAKDELVDVPAGIYRIHKFTLGGTYNFQQNKKVEQGIGSSVDFYAYPSALKPFYGKSPVSFNVFYRLRFGKM